MHVKHITSNIKGGVDCELGQKTLIIGPNGRGKSAVINSVELALGGSASDIVGRAEVKRVSDLLALSSDGAIEVRATLSDSQPATWSAARNAQGGAKKATHSCPVRASFPVRDVRAALGGNPETARSWLLSRAVSDVSREDVTAWFVGDTTAAYERLAGSAGSSEIDTLLDVLRRAGQDCRAKKRQLKSDHALLNKMGNALDPEPTAADIANVIAQAEAALEQYEEALKSSGKAAAMADVETARHTAERLVEAYGQMEQEGSALSSEAPGAQLSPQELRMTERLRLLAQANSLHEEVEAAHCIVCESLGPFDHSALRERKVEAAAGLESRAQWWEAESALRVAARNAKEQAERAVAAFHSARDRADGICKSALSTHEAKEAWEGLHMKKTAVEAAAVQWHNLRSQKDGIRQLRADIGNLEDLLESGAQAVNRLLKTAVGRFEGQVQSYLPEGDAFRLVLEEDGKPVCRLGFERQGVLHTALSGAEWARLTLALACAASEGTEGILVFAPEERAFDPDTLRAVMAALSDAPGQVLLTSPVRHKGRLPKGWTVLDLTEVGPVSLNDSTRTAPAGSPA